MSGCKGPGRRSGGGPCGFSTGSPPVPGKAGRRRDGRVRVPRAALGPEATRE
jgi:hypothetical protein